jgi:uncharacterized protein YlaI
MSKKNVRKWKRSGTEECDICEEETPLVEHHIHGREVRDAEKPWNKTWICPNCHDKVHLGHIIIEGWFLTSKGMELIWRKSGDSEQVSEGASPPTY